MPLEAEVPGLRRVVVDSAVGPITVRTGRAAGGPATVLLHGAAGSWTTWTPLLRAADASGSPITDVIAVDLPGWGDSPAPEHVLTPAAASAAVAEVARALGYDRWTLIGHSLGGFVALDLAARESAATLRVGLVSPTGAAVVDAIRRPVRGGVRLPWFAGMLLAMRTLDLLPRDGRTLLATLDARGLFAALSRPLFADPTAVDPSVVHALAAEIRPRAFGRAVRAAARYDLDAWRSISCPVRSVQGATDVFVRASDAAAMAQRIPDCRTLTLAGAGHFAAVERPAEVLAFLRS